MRSAGLAAGQRPAPWGLLLGVSIAVAALFVLDAGDPFLAAGPGPEPSSPAAAVGRPAAQGASNYAEALENLDSSVAVARQEASTRPGEWLFQEVLARRYIARAKLTGSYDDYAAAQSALDEAFALAPPGAGPHRTQAQLHFTMHRLVAAERALDEIGKYAVPPDAQELAEIAAMRGDIAFYRGRYNDALARYAAADRLAPGASDFRRAVFAAKTGHPDVADEYFRRFQTESGTAFPQALANVELQRGIVALDNKRLAAAMRHFKTADRIFPGHWLIEEHIAEATRLSGSPDAAAAMYRRIVGKTGHPEFMDALASIAESRGQHALAQHWRSRAWSEWQRRLRLFPEAAYGHALQHCIDKGDAPCALDLAIRNHAARQFGEAKLKLAEALLINGRKADAAQLIRAAASSGWDPAAVAAASDKLAYAGD